jgi:conjugative relaxase-like TrwC/TraI family protein
MISTGGIYRSLEKYEADNYYLNKDPELNMQTAVLAGNGWDKLNVDKNYELKNTDFSNLTKGKDLNGNYLSDEFKKSHRGGFDLTWSTDKSITAYAFKDKETLEKVSNIMLDIAKDAAKFAEQNGFIQYRETVNGETISKTSDNATALINLHLAGRQDPQMHVHMAFMNFTQTANNEFKALNSDALFMNKLTIQSFMENELSHRLQSELGIKTEFEKTGRGQEYGTKVARLDKNVWEGIAQTSKKIDNYLESHKDELKQKYPQANETKLREYAYLAVRNSKESKTLSELFDKVDKGLAEKGLTRNDIDKLIVSYKEPEQKLSANDIVKNAIAELENKKSSFTNADILKTALQLSAGQYDSKTIVNAVEQQKQQLISLDKYQIETNKRTYEQHIFTTKEIANAEKNIVKIVENGKDKVEAITQQVYKNDKLTESQNKAVNFILHAKDQVIAIEGRAGTGKTTFLTELKKELEQAGYTLKGTSTTNTAVNEMISKNIESVTTTKFLNQQQELNSKTVLVIDESSFLSTKELNNILQKATEAQARVVMLGDTKQLSGVEAGSPFALLIKNDIIKNEQLSDIIRQKTDTAKAIVENAYNKDIKNLLEKADVKEIKDTKQAVAEITKDYLSKDYTKTNVITATNADKNLINQSIHNELFKDKEQLTITVFDRKQLDGLEKYQSKNYSSGNQISVLGSGSTGIITKVENNQITADFYTRKGIETRTFDITKNADKIAVYEKKELKIAKDERVILTANIKSQNGRLANSSFGTITKIDTKNNTFDLKVNDKTITLHANDSKNYFDYAYAITADRSQGKTIENAIVYNTRNYENTLVAVSRATHNVTIYTNDKEQFLKQSNRSETDKRVEEMHYDKIKDIKTEPQQQQQKNLIDFRTETPQKIEQSFFEKQTNKLLSDLNKHKINLFANTFIKDTKNGLAFGTTTKNLFNTKAIETSKVFNKDIKYRTEKSYTTTLFNERKINVFSVIKNNNVITINKYTMQKDFFRYEQKNNQTFRIDLKQTKQQLNELKQRLGETRELKRAEKDLNRFSKSLSEKDFNKLQQDMLKVNQQQLENSQHKSIDNNQQQSLTR